MAVKNYIKNINKQQKCWQSCNLPNGDEILPNFVHFTSNIPIIPHKKNPFHPQFRDDF